MQGDLKVAALLTGGDDDAVDDFAQGFRGLAGVVGMAQRFRQALDPAAVDVTDVGMDVGQVGRGLRQPRVEFVLFGFELGQTDRQGAMVSALMTRTTSLIAFSVSASSRRVVAPDVRRSRLRRLVSSA